MNKVFRVTGNPFVDTGQAVISSIAGKDSFTDLTLDEVKEVFGTGKEIADWNLKLKSFTQVFGNNGLLSQPRSDPAQKRQNAYIAFLSNLLEQIEEPDSCKDNGVCEICGEFPSYNKTAVEEALKPYKKSDFNHDVGRHNFPLIGSVSEIQALPGLSRMFNVCPRCLFAVNYIPIGTRLLNGRLIAFESTHNIFIQDIIDRIVETNLDKVAAGGDKIETIGKNQSSAQTVQWISESFREIQERKKRKQIPKNLELNIWLFTNSGTNPDCDILSIPNDSVQFLWEAGTYGLNNEIDPMSKRDKRLQFPLLDAIRNKIDYKGLYPADKYNGASVKFYSFYQQKLLGIPHETLVACQKLASEILPETKKEQKKWLKSDVFYDYGNKALLKNKIVEAIENGTMGIDDYFLIFPTESTFPLKSSYEGFNRVRFFLHHTDEQIPDFGDNNGKGVTTMKMHPRIMEAAELYFNDFVSEKGMKRFQKEVLSDFKRENKSPLWLKNTLVNLAENHDGFGPQDWDEFWHDLSHDENGNFVGYELVFQMRLALTDLYRQAKDNN